jgi:hypothetical protein
LQPINGSITATQAKYRGYSLSNEQSNNLFRLKTQKGDQTIITH